MVDMLDMQYSLVVDLLDMQLSSGGHAGLSTRTAEVKS